MTPFELTVSSSSKSRQVPTPSNGSITFPVGVFIEDEHGNVLANAASHSDGPCAAIASRHSNQGDQWEQTVQTPTGEQTLLFWRESLPGSGMTATVAVNITEQKLFEDALKRRAYLDDLTGLPNRLNLQETIDRLLANRERSSCFALAFLDLDNFKHVNDYYTHAVGDALLREVSRRLSHVVRQSDIVGRISGDEFLILINGFDSEEWLVKFIDEIARCLKEPFQLEGFEIFSSASIGVSVYPEHGDSYEALRRHADSAMYEAKAGGKGKTLVFNRSVGRTVEARMAREQRLRLAINDGQFCCAFQPKVDLRTHSIMGVEALARLRTDDGDIESAGAFVGLAKELGLLDNLTDLILHKIIDSADEVDDVFGLGTPISINVAAGQASSVRFMRSFCDELERTGNPSRFIVEVTEDAFVAGNAMQSKVLPMLRELGVKLSIDDFGTGYSCLSTLADITADELKIDRSFITNIHIRARNQSVLKAIESLGETLGMTIVAEGVETLEELQYLQASTQIQVAQGFYFSRPLDLEIPRATLSGRHRRSFATCPSRASAEANPTTW